MAILARSTTSVININDGAKGDKGDRGISVTSEKEQWYLSTSNSSLSGGTWSYQEPTQIPDNKYLWGRLEFTMSDGTKQYSNAVYRSVIDGILNVTDEINKKITQKVWQSDITSSINSYDSSTAKAIRDRVTVVEEDLEGIHTTISDIESDVDSKADSTTVTTLNQKVNTIENTTTSHTQQISSLTSTVNQKADSSTVSELQQTVTTNEQTASTFRQTVASTYATKNELNTAKSEIKQTTDGISTEVSKKVGNNEIISKINQSPESITIDASKVDLIGNVTFSMLDNSTQSTITSLQQNTESIIGTQTTNTYYWTGESQYTTFLYDGLTIQYLLPRSVDGSQFSATYINNLSTGATTNTNGCALNLTLANGEETGNIPIWYQGVGRLTSHYGYGSSIRLVYHRDLVVNGSYKATGWWVEAQYNSDTVDNRIVYFTGKTGDIGIWAWSLFMRDGNGTYQNICTASDGTVTNASSGNGARTNATTKLANPHGFQVGSPIWTSSTSYNKNTNIANTNVVFSSYGNLMDSRIMFNTTLTANNLTPYQNIYLVGTVHNADGLFYLDSTWWTQTPTDTSKVYVLVGGVFDSTTSNSRMTLYEDNKWLVYRDGKLVDYNKDLANVADDKASKTLAMKVNYSAFSQANPGECYLHGYTDGVPTDTNGYIYWNGTKITIPKTMINPNAVCPYYKIVYIVLRLSSNTATSGTLYLVWYDSSWKSAVASPSSSTTWTWIEDRDIVLGQFVETSSEGEIVDAYLYEPPRNASHVTNGNNAYGYSQNAVNWVNTNGNGVLTAKTILNNWATDATKTTTTIKGGLIQTHTITSEQLATNAIMSSNYIAGSSGSPYSALGTFLDLSTGNIYMPNFGVNAQTGSAYFNGQIIADSGSIGSDTTNYWSIGTFTDYDGNDSAGIIGNGTSYIQSGKWMISNDRIDTRWYDNQRKITYINNSNTYWDYGMQVPDPSASQDYKKNFLYIRKHASTIPTVESDWEYPFRVTNDGTVYAKDIVITGGTSGTFLPLSGGTISGNLTVTGTLSATASKANQLTHSISINGQSFDGSANVTVSTLGVKYGGTGATTFTSGAALIGNGQGAITTRGIRNNTSAGTLGWTGSAVDITLVTTNTIAYWDGRYAGNQSNLQYVKLGKLGTVVTHDYDEFITTDGGIIDGSLYVTDLTAGSLVVNGVGRFVDGLYGNVTGNLTGVASEAVKVQNNLKIQINGGTTEGTNQFTYNGSAAKNINITKSSIGLGNVDNTADANKSVASATTATKFASAQSIALTGDTTGSVSSQAGWSITTTTSKLNSGGRLTSANVDNSSATYRNKLTYFYSSSSMTEGKPPEDGGILNFAWDNNIWGAQLAIHINAKPHLYLRGNNNKAWDTDWLTVLDSGNYNNYAPTKTGTGASGTWGISISGNAATATKATQDGDGKTISSTYLKLSGGTLTGDLTIQRTTSIAQNYPAIIKFTTIQTDNNITTSSSYIAVYDDHDNAVYGQNMVIDATSSLFIGAGEGAGGLYGLKKDENPEALYLSADGNIFVQSNTNGNDMPDRLGFILNVNHEILPIKAETLTNNVGSIGNSSYKWANVYATTLHGKLDSRTITIGDTGKSVDWSKNISWSKAEISGNASNTANGWMSKDDKAKLDQITVSDIGTVGANSIVGATNGGINVSISQGVATLKHTNQLSAGGTAQGTTASTLTNGGSFTVPKIVYDINGHITSTGTNKLTLPNITTITGNAGTATKFASAQSVTLTGDTTGTASSQAGWSISTTTTKLSQISLANLTSLSGFTDTNALIYTSYGGSNTITDKPDSVDAFGAFSFKTAQGWHGQLLISSNQATGIYWRTGTSLSGGWKKILDSTNYTDYTVTKTGSGASGTWGISITGNAATATSATSASSATNATNDGDGNKISDTYLKKSGGTLTGAINTANNTWNKIGDDVQIGDINQAGKLGIQGINGNTGIFFTTYNQTTKTTGGTIIWDGTKFSITGTVATSISGNAATATTANSAGALTGITASRFVIGNGTSSSYASGHMEYYNNVSIPVNSEYNTKRNGFWIWGQTEGNDATRLISGTAGVLRYGDGGPQIVFSGGADQSQAGALIFTDHDSCGAGVSWHFVSNQTDWNVNSKRFVAKTSVTVGTNVPNTSYNLHVTGNAHITGATTGASFGASSYLCANTGNSATGGGLALYGTNPAGYGLAMRSTSNGGKHGFVQGDWGIYSYITGSENTIQGRGWVWRNTLNAVGTNVASISSMGHAVFNGSVTVGGNANNDSGCKMVFNTTTDSLDFVFN